MLFWVFAALCVAAAAAAAAAGAWDLVRTWLMLRDAPGPRPRGIMGTFHPSHIPIMHRLYRVWAETYGPVYRLRMAYIHLMVVLNPGPEIFKLPKPKQFRSIECLSFDRPNIVTALTPTPLWKTVRRAVLPVFSSHHLRARYPEALKVVEGFLEDHVRRAAQTGQPVEFLHTLPVLMLHLLSHVGFEVDLTSQESQPRMQAMVDSTAAVALEGFKRAMDPFRHLYFWHSDVRAGKRTIQQYNQIMRDFTKECRAAALKVPYEQRERSIATALANATLPTGERLSEEQMAAEVAIFFFAGMDTSSHQTAWMLYFLATNPACRRKLAAELEEAGIKSKSGGRPLRPVAYEDLGRLTYLNAVIQESMRLEPVAAGGVVRETDRDMNIGTVLVPRGAMIVVPFYAAFTRTGNFADPLKFKPERWLQTGVKSMGAAATMASTAAKAQCPVAAEAALGDGSEEPGKSAGDSGTAFPFSAGNRNCVGRALAQMNMQLFIARLFAEFDVELSDTMQAEDAYKDEELQGTSRPMKLDLKFMPW